MRPMNPLEHAYVNERTAGWHVKKCGKRTRAFRPDCSVILIKLIKKDLHKRTKLIIMGVQCYAFHLQHNEAGDIS